LTSQLQNDTLTTERELRRCAETLKKKEYSVDKFYGLAYAKVGLSIVAGHLADISRQGNVVHERNKGKMKLIHAAEDLCRQTDFKQLKCVHYLYL